MLSCHSFTVRAHPGGPPLVTDACAHFGGGGLHAVIGPSGCGKTTLLKGILAILPAEGELRWREQPVASQVQLLREVAFAPQFSIAHGKLTVAESLTYALRLYHTLPPVERAHRVAEILQLVGLTERAQTVVEQLSGGQLRRLGLALELTTDPACLLCDEVTSGLDPRSEDQILAVLRSLVHMQGKTVVCVIHNLAKLHQFDTITVVYSGAVIFQGRLPELLTYFRINDALLLYDRLHEQPLAHWRAQWTPLACAAPVAPMVSLPTSNPASEPTPGPAARLRPSWHRQVLTLLHRRLHLIWRDRGYLLLILAITFGFPCLVVIFALGGLPQVRGLSLEQTSGLMETLQARALYRQSAAESATLVSGLIMFQVILLCLMGSNNGAREIAGERAWYEKERMSGLRPAAYATAKIIYISLLGAVQGIWMTLFVKWVCQFPGDSMAQLAVWAMVGASLSVVCLGLSALLVSADQASLLSIYLVGFQLPLSGVVLALPSALVWAVRPFITTYWGWSGYLMAMTESRLYDAVTMLDKGWLAPPIIAGLVLLLHYLLGVGLVFWGCHRKAWPR